MADKGLMLDAPSGASTENTKPRIEELELEEERFGEVNTETQKSETGTDLEVGAPSKLRVKG